MTPKTKGALIAALFIPWVDFANLPLRCATGELMKVKHMAKVAQGEMAEPGTGYGLAICIDDKWIAQGFWEQTCVNTFAGTPLEEQTCPKE